MSHPEDEADDTEEQELPEEEPEQPMYRSSGPSQAMRKVRDAKPLLAMRGHYCLAEYRGDKCPGPDRCTTAHEATAQELANRCNRSGVRDGVRCSGCGRWGETASDIRHGRPDCTEEWEPARKPVRPATTPPTKPLPPLR